MMVAGGATSRRRARMLITTSAEWTPSRILAWAGKVGAAIKILGTNLTGASSVTFGGIPAHFTVASPTVIATAVPAGAATGNVQVTTPSGTLVSNVPFRVMR